MGKKPRDERQQDLFFAADIAVAERAAPGRAEEPHTGSITHAQLVERLCAGHAQRLTVVTPSLRLAQSLEAEVDRRQRDAGETLWEAPDILAFPIFLQRCHEEAAYTEAGAGLPMLLDGAAAMLLWEDVIRASAWGDALLSKPAASRLAAEAWTLAHGYRIERALGMDAGEDAQAFAQWAREYESRMQALGATDAARLPGSIAPLLADGTVARPATLVLYAFDRRTPQQDDFFHACARAGIAVLHCAAPSVAGAARRLLAESPRQELELAARWARARLEAASAAGREPRIGIVVPELAQRRREVRRVLARVFGPGDGDGAPFNISLGEPLSAAPLVDAALAVLQLGAGAVAFEHASRIIRSPFIAGATTEAAERARLDAALRRVGSASLTPKRLLQQASEATRRLDAPVCHRLGAAIDRLIVSTGDWTRAQPCEWARRFTLALDAVGFPGERTLDSAEFQAHARWTQALTELAALTTTAGRWDAPEALSRLQRLCDEILFQPRSGAAPVQVLGLLESVGLAFDHLWVSGLDEGTWPMPARPHPLISPALQRSAGVPQASAEAALRVDQEITAGWRQAAAEVVFSSARAEADRELLVSPLVAKVPLASASDIGIPEYADRRRVLMQAREGAMREIEDDRGAPVGAAAVQGGTGILVDQAACPFRAFAHYRLDARGLEHPQPGLGPPERGTLLHTMMARLWEALKDSATLQAIDAAALEALVREAAAHAVERMRADRPGRMEERFARLEQERLAGIALEWLDLERTRPPFSVHMREEKFTLAAGPLAINGRVDRVDRLGDGSLAVIDYKSGEVHVARWMGERPEDAQLPLYALAAAARENVRAVAFAKLKAGDRGFNGVARDADAIPGVTAIEKQRTVRNYAATWDELFACWRREVDRLGEGFAGGEAQVDPKQLLATCRYCDLKPLCRVHERLTPLDEGDEDESSEEEA